MATKKKSPSKKQKSSPLLPLGFGLLAVSAIVAAYFFRFSPEVSKDPLVITDKTGIAKPVLPPSEILGKIVEFSQKEVDKTKSQTFGAYTLLTNKEDINADKKLESVVIRPSTRPVYSEIDAFGYSTIVEELLIYVWEKDGPKLAFSLTEKGIKGEQGQHLIQMAESFGYAFSTETYTNKKHYKYPVTIYNVMTLNKDGKPASDELTIYYKPSEKAYRISNTFEAPGTF